ncbi:ParB N-terminal domain-containing protein [Ralstonia mannitolilytica]|uniref:transporter substrate-binding domain-containing protein n=1 Tax=Ralstonia mannitolilytica TaxID=105219 RepID=UPI00374858AB
MTLSWLADKIERWPTAKLVPYARNARTHSDAQVAQIAASIAEFGFTNPILAGSDGVIVAGHGRLAAAQKLGLEMVPVVVLDHLTPTQRRALVIADNRIAENAGWDDELLRIELEALQDEGFDLDLTGFDADALAELLAGDEPDGEGETDDDAVPEVSETPVSRPGDVWLLGGQVQLVTLGNIVANAVNERTRLRQLDVKFPVEDTPCYVGVGKGETALLDKVNAAITKFKTDGRLNELSQRWIKMPLPTQL